MQTTTLKIYGMTCTLCSASIEAGLEKLDGIGKASVSYAAERAVVEYDGEKLSPDGIREQIESFGFLTDRKDAAGHSGAARDPAQLVRRRSLHLLIFAAIFSAPLIVCMITWAAGVCCNIVLRSSQPLWAQYLDRFLQSLSFLHTWWLQLALATPVQFIAGARFYRNAFRSLRAGKPTMDLLVVFGSTSAYVYSIYVVLFQLQLYEAGWKSVYFEASAVIITLALLGKYLEMLARGKMSQAIQSLITLAPKNARVRKDGKEVYLPVEQVAAGDLLLVKPGEKVPVDGVITEGFSLLNESVITGESLPVEKKAGDTVTGASLNQNGSFTFRATKVGEETRLAEIIRVVEQAQSSKAPIQKLADTVSGYFIPAVVAVAVFTFLFSFFVLYHGSLYILDYAIMNAVSVLVVSCPCALGLATPAALMVGLGRGARSGILIKNGEILEKAHAVDTVVLDKTGTLTTGVLEVTDTIGLHGYAARDILRIAAAAEKHSEHPLGAAIYRKGKTALGQEPQSPARFEAVPGRGVRAVTGGHLVQIGSPAYLAEIGIGADEELEEVLAALYRGGKTAVVAAVDGQAAGAFGLADHIREDAAATVARLRKEGMEVWMVTGDHPHAAAYVAQQAGIAHVRAGVLPENKAEEVCRLREERHCVAMVGDGINDAPALAAADVGIAVGSGTDVAIETGDVVLLRRDLCGLPDTFALARQTMRKIRQNLFWAFLYNIVAIPVAASGHLSPTVAAAAMAFSSVSVLLNSLSLRKMRLVSQPLENEPETPARPAARAAAGVS